LARFRELEHELHQAVDRLAESEHLLSLVETELTRFRDIEYPAAEAMSRCAAVETRIALTERLTTPSNYMTKPTSGIPQEKIGLAAPSFPQISPGSRSICKDDTEKSASASGIKTPRESGALVNKLRPLFWK
jgi:hypothetical protein